jgi:hypothetical protein
MMKSASSALCALALSLVLIGQTVTVPTSHAAETGRTFVGALA